ncbi:MAG TPA: cysteine peptidase family C39 domain-containing protein [Candidatus Wallbacteria bacterium]|nr:cysteine peptidase family C39 domain-containing protein [Candidatus Wallbacteria bacterium]
MAGRKAFRLGRAAHYSAVAAGFLMMGAQVYFYYNPQIEARVFSYIDYPYFRWWGASFIFLVIGARYDKLKAESPNFAALVTVMAFLAVAFLWRISIFNADNNFDEAGYFRGVCFQSTGHTCSAAACVQLLKSFGVKAGEAEMSKLCLTQITGTEYINIVRGLKLKLDKDIYEVDLTSETWDNLKNLTLPFITNIYVLDGILHTVTVTAVNTAEVTLADPLEGRFVTYKKEKFIKAWEKLVIHVKMKTGRH